MRLLLGILGTAVLVVGCSQSDSGITTSVKSKLVADDMVKARNINVDTRDRVVTLTGTVRPESDGNAGTSVYAASGPRSRSSSSCARRRWAPASPAGAGS